MNRLNFNPSDDDCITAIMKNFGNLDNMIFGEDEQGNSITMSISPTQIITETLQSNGWIRTNTYTLDDGIVVREESYKKQEYIIDK